MAEAFAILSVVANIAQLTEYALVLVSETREILASARGVTKENLEIEVIVRTIQERHEALVQSAASGTGNDAPSRGERAILKLADRCGPITKELLKILEKQSAKNSKFPKLESLRAALVATSNKKTIQDLKRRLLDIETQIGREMTSMLNDGQSHIVKKISRLEEILGSEDVGDSKILSALLQELKAYASSLSLQEGERSDQKLKQLLASAGRLSKQAREVEWEQRIFDSLSFEELRERESSIKRAHENTLDWVFDNPDTRFTRWLESENDVYWIQGRAGSGKSTLMKHVAAHRKTSTALQTWAGTKRAVQVSFFFWSSGLPLQKTQKGLLRSLLYQIFCNCKPLMRRVCPERIPAHWGLEDLVSLLQKMGDDKDDSQFKFCLFIDGLDEYEGEPETIVKALQTLSASPNIKLCVSSRPWVPFLKAFGREQNMLVVQDFTEKDMIAYAAKELYDDERFSALARKDVTQFETLPTAIAKKAVGVWLWTFLVVRNIRRDLTDHDSFEDIEHNLFSFPSELEAFYDKMLKADSVDQQETSRILLMAVEAVKPLSALVLDWLAEETRQPEFATWCEPQTIQSAAVVQVRKSWDTKLSTRCRDLLEIHEFDSKEVIWTYRLDFLHRTVRDFLLNSYQPILRQRAPAAFSSARSLCRMTLKLLKSIRPPRPGQDSCSVVFSLVDEFLGYAKRLDMRDEADSDMIEQVDRVVTAYIGHYGTNHWTNAREPLPETNFDEWGQSSFLALAIQAKLTKFVELKLRASGKHGLGQEKQGRPLLDYALRPKRVIGSDLPIEFRAEEQLVDMKLVRLLLEHDANLNAPVYLYPDPSGAAQTVWTLFLTYCLDNSARVPPREIQAWHSAVGHLVSSGNADIHAQIRVKDPRPEGFSKSVKLQHEFGSSWPAYTGWTVMQVVSRVFPESQARLLVNAIVDTHARRCWQSWGYWLRWGWSLNSWEKRQRENAAAIPS